MPTKSILKKAKKLCLMGVKLWSKVTVFWNIDRTARKLLFGIVMHVHCTLLPIQYESVKTTRKSKDIPRYDLEKKENLLQKIY